MEDLMKRAVILVTWLLLLSLASLHAQKKGESATRSVQGVVTSADDAPVANAVVQLENTKTQQIRSYITKEDGVYHFYELSPEIDYKVKADFQGATSGAKTLTSFDSRKLAVINLKLNKK
jgi:hypothetical protein